MTPFDHLYRLVLSLLQFTAGGDTFDNAFDVLVRLWCRCVELERPEALMRSAAAAVASQAMVIAVDAHGVGVSRDWRSDVERLVTDLPPAAALDQLTDAVIALGELRPGWQRLDPARAEAALRVAAAAITLGMAWCDERPAPPFRRFATGAPLEAS